MMINGYQSALAQWKAVMKGNLYTLFILSLFTCFLASCKSETEDFQPYSDWQSRNAAWYEQIADSARQAIRTARSQYGSAWEDHCDWRMYKSILLGPNVQTGDVQDSICVHILQRGSGTEAPAYTDSVRVAFRGWLMPTTNELGQQEELIFTQTYYGVFDPATAAPQLSSIIAFRDGFATALQYMKEGDDWMVYIPQKQFFGSSSSGIIPAYSTVRFRIYLMGVYPTGTPIPK